MWKDINNWEDYYEVNEHGKVRNKLTNHIISEDTNSCGYKRVTLRNKQHDPQAQRFFVHRLVAESFISNPNNLKEVNHKDCDTSNNHYTNLEWVNKKDNELHSRKYGSKVYKPFIVKYQNGKSKTYDSRSDLAEELKVSRECIKFWLHNKNKGYIKHGIKEIYYI